MTSGKGWRTMVVHEYYAKVSEFSDNIGQLDLTIVYESTTVSIDNANEIFIQINQALSKPDEDVLLMSTFQVR